MIHGIGVDLSYIPRFKSIIQSSHHARFLAKMLHPNEIQRYQAIGQPHQSSAPSSIHQPTNAPLSGLPLDHSLTQRVTFLASRWAVKEAAVKASGVRLIFPDMEIVRSVHPPSTKQSTNHPLEPSDFDTDKQPSLNRDPKTIKISLDDHDPRPRLILTGESLSMCCKLGIDPNSISLSLSHDGDYATAFIIMMKKQNHSTG